VRALKAVAGELAAGETGSRDLVEQCLAQIADPDGEGARAFITVDSAAALMLMGRHGKDRPLFSAGLTVESIIAGQS